MLSLVFRRWSLAVSELRPRAFLNWEDFRTNLRRKDWGGGSTAARRDSGVALPGNAASIPAGASCYGVPTWHLHYSLLLSIDVTPTGNAVID